MKKSILWASVLAVVVLVGLLVLTTSRQGSQSPSGPSGSDFVLQSADGVVDSKTLRGKVLLIYFGYTNCPDICPASLANGGQALNALTSDERAKVKMLLVSVDPARDTLARLKEYTAYFHPEMQGITGSAAEIAALAKSFGAGYVAQAAKADGSYAVFQNQKIYKLLINKMLFFR